jgi:integrase/recombinase XerD
MEARYITAAQLAALRGAMSDAEWLVCWVMLETGLRVGDAVALRGKNLKKDGLHYRAAKTGKAGIAPISAALRAALVATGARGDAPFFPSPKTGRPISRQAIWARIKRAAARAGLDVQGVSPHALRKVFAVEMFREKGMEAAREALQHGSKDTTEIYAYADFCTGENATKPLVRSDIKMLIAMCAKALARTEK